MCELMIELIGPLRVTGPNGKDLTPKAARVRALLALLCETPLRKRSRRWLVARLWSDRPFAKSGMSLRNALMELRKNLAPFGDAVCSSRSEIWLDEGKVSIDLAHPSDVTGAATVLEGLHYADDGFEDWLRELRGVHGSAESEQGPTARPCGIHVVASVGDACEGTSRVTAGLIADQVSQNIEDMVGSVRRTRPLSRSDVEITTQMSETSEVALFSAQVVHGPTDTVLYSGFREIRKTEGQALSAQVIAEFSHNVAGRALAKLPLAGALERDEIVALGFAELAKRRLFSYRPEEVDAAGPLFAKAFDADPGGIFLAWKAFQKTALVIEGMAPRTAQLMDECEGLLRRAAELAPESAQTHGLIALVRLMLFDDFPGALTAAEAGLRRNPNCLLSRQALAMTIGAFGDKDTAYRATSFCRPAFANDDARHLWDLYHGLVCIATDRYDEALSALTNAARRCPSFKAPHRQLVALHMHRGDAVQARHHLDMLADLETGFSLDTYLRDPEYPVDTLRSKGLLQERLEILG